ncbi:MAG: hypothetical protein RR981_07835, partial [Oscillospiraceae bacterium]
LTFWHRCTDGLCKQIQIVFVVIHNHKIHGMFPHFKQCICHSCFILQWETSEKRRGFSAFSKAKKP